MISYIEISAKTGSNVDYLFETITKNILNYQLLKQNMNKKDNQYLNQNGNYSLCCW